MRPGLFNDPFYSYQYATAAVAANAISNRIRAGDIAFRDRYIDYLKAGRSIPHTKLLKDWISIWRAVRPMTSI